jgi:hypothetical protein
VSNGALPPLVDVYAGFARTMALWPTIQANRVIRELKRMELLMASRRGA